MMTTPNTTQKTHPTHTPRWQGRRVDTKRDQTRRRRTGHAWPRQHNQARLRAAFKAESGLELNAITFEYMHTRNAMELQRLISVMTTAKETAEIAAGCEDIWEQMDTLLSRAYCLMATRRVNAQRHKREAADPYARLKRAFRWLTTRPLTIDWIFPTKSATA